MKLIHNLKIILNIKDQRCFIERAHRVTCMQQLWWQQGHWRYEQILTLMFSLSTSRVDNM